MGSELHESEVVSDDRRRLTTHCKLVTGVADITAQTIPLSTLGQFYSNEDTPDKILVLYPEPTQFCASPTPTIWFSTDYGTNYNPISGSSSLTGQVMENQLQSSPYSQWLFTIGVTSDANIDCKTWPSGLKLKIKFHYREFILDLICECGPNLGLPNTIPEIGQADLILIHMEPATVVNFPTVSSDLIRCSSYAYGVTGAPTGVTASAAPWATDPAQVAMVLTPPQQYQHATEGESYRLYLQIYADGYRMQWGFDIKVRRPYFISDFTSADTLPTQYIMFTEGTQRYGFLPEVSAAYYTWGGYTAGDPTITVSMNGSQVYSDDLTTVPYVEYDTVSGEIAFTLNTIDTDRDLSYFDFRLEYASQVPYADPDDPYPDAEFSVELIDPCADRFLNIDTDTIEFSFESIEISSEETHYVIFNQPDITPAFCLEEVTLGSVEYSFTATFPSVLNGVEMEIYQDPPPYIRIEAPCIPTTAGMHTIEVEIAFHKSTAITSFEVEFTEPPFVKGYRFLQTSSEYLTTPEWYNITSVLPFVFRPLIHLDLPFRGYDEHGVDPVMSVSDVSKISTIGASYEIDYDTGDIHVDLESHDYQLRDLIYTFNFDYAVECPYCYGCYDIPAAGEMPHEQILMEYFTDICDRNHFLENDFQVPVIEVDVVQGISTTFQFDEMQDWAGEVAGVWDFCGPRTYHLDVPYIVRDLVQMEPQYRNLIVESKLLSDVGIHSTKLITIMQNHASTTSSVLTVIPITVLPCEMKSYEIQGSPAYETTYDLYLGPKSIDIAQIQLHPLKCQLRLKSAFAEDNRGNPTLIVSVNSDGTIATINSSDKSLAGTTQHFTIGMIINDPPYNTQINLISITVQFQMPSKDDILSSNRPPTMAGVSSSNEIQALPDLDFGAGQSGWQFTLPAISDPEANQLTVSMAVSKSQKHLFKLSGDKVILTEDPARYPCQSFNLFFSLKDEFESETVITFQGQLVNCPTVELTEKIWVNETKIVEVKAEEQVVPVILEIRPAGLVRVQIQENISLNKFYAYDLQSMLDDSVQVPTDDPDDIILKPVIEVLVIPGLLSDNADLKFNATMISFNPDQGVLFLQIDFFNPSLVSQHSDYSDFFQVKFWDQDLFVFQDTSDVIYKLRPGTSATHVLGKMLSPEVAEQLEQVGSTSLLVAIVLLIVNYLLLGSVSTILSILEIMTLLYHLMLYNEPLPSEVENFYGYMFPIICFDYLPTEKFYELYPSYFKYDAVNSRFNSFGYEAKQMILNLGSAFLPIVLGVAILLIGTLLEILKNSCIFSEKICGPIIRAKNKIFYFKSVGYLKDNYILLAMSATINIKHLQWSSNPGDQASLIFSYLTMTCLVVFPFMQIVRVRNNFREANRLRRITFTCASKGEASQKYVADLKGRYYTHCLDVLDVNASIFFDDMAFGSRLSEYELYAYGVILKARDLALAVTLVYLDFAPVAQIYVFLNVFLFCMGALMLIRPYLGYLGLYKALANDIFCVFVVYTMIYCTDFNDYDKESTAYWLLGLINFYIALNLLPIFIKTFRAPYYRAKRWYVNRAIRNKQAEIQRKLVARFEKLKKGHQQNRAITVEKPPDFHQVEEMARLQESSGHHQRDISLVSNPADQTADLLIQQVTKVDISAAPGDQDPHSADILLVNKSNQQVQSDQKSKFEIDKSIENDIIALQLEQQQQSQHVQSKRRTKTRKVKQRKRLFEEPPPIETFDEPAPIEPQRYTGPLVIHNQPRQDDQFVQYGQKPAGESPFAVLLRQQSVLPAEEMSSAQKSTPFAHTSFLREDYRLNDEPTPQVETQTKPSQQRPNKRSDLHVQRQIQNEYLHRPYKPGEEHLNSLTGNKETPQSQYNWDLYNQVLNGTYEPDNKMTVEREKRIREQEEQLERMQLRADKVKRPTFGLDISSDDEDVAPVPFEHRQQEITPKEEVKQEEIWTYI